MMSVHHQLFYRAYSIRQVISIARLRRLASPQTGATCTTVVPADRQMKVVGFQRERHIIIVKPQSTLQ
jgi:hypothetical protein